MPWHHAPAHHLAQGGTYFITGATVRKQHFFGTPKSRDLLQEILFEKAAAHDCWLQAWCLLSNHYHLVVQCDDGTKLRKMVAQFHGRSGHELNRAEGVTNRQVWFQYWDKTLTFEGSWLARLRYTHENAVHHQVVRDAREYAWCSASWFEKSASESFVRTVRGMKIDALAVRDDY